MLTDEDTDEDAVVEAVELTEELADVETEELTDEDAVLEAVVDTDELAVEDAVEE